MRCLTEGTWKCSQHTSGQREPAFLGVIALDTIGILSCAATCGTTEKDWPEEMPKATAKPLHYQDKKDKTEARGGEDAFTCLVLVFFNSVAYRGGEGFGGVQTPLPKFQRPPPKLCQTQHDL